MVPFLDMSRMHKPLEEKFVEAFKDIVARSAFVNGPEVKAFESEFANWVGTDHCVGMSSGLDAEVIGLRAIGVRPGDKVLVPAMTFIATSECVSHAGAEPVLVDVDEAGLMDLDRAEEALKSGIKFMLPVHLFGELMDMDRLADLQKRYDVKIFEDACQAHGAKRSGVAAGTLGSASAFSFYPGKNLGALGDGGALCTSSSEVREMAVALREHGQTEKYHHKYEGYTCRLDNLQAAFLSFKLEMMDTWNAQRVEAAKLYREYLGTMSHAKLQSDKYDGSHVYHLMVLLTERRAELSEALKEASIGFGYHYPIPLHQLECYSGRSWAKGSFPNSEKFAQQGISLPIFPGITEAEVKEVCQVVKRVCG